MASQLHNQATMNAVAIDLAHAATGGTETGFSGYVHGVALVDLLQIFHYSRRSLVLHIEPNAAIHLSDGEIVHARSGELEGEVAISCLLDQAGGRIRTADAEVVPTTIRRPFNFLLLDALRGMDESQRDADVELRFDESGEFLKESLRASRGSILPSVPAAGSPLLGTACAQLAERVENARAVALIDLKARHLVAMFGSVARGLLEQESLAAFERPDLRELERALIGAGSIQSTSALDCLEEVRYVGRSGAYFGKVLSGRTLALILCARCEDSPGLAWAELRQSARMVERILP